MLWSGLPFPSSLGNGQAELVRELENALAEKQVLLHAPTGYGKTAAALYAALQVAYRAGISVFFATARTTRQLVVEDTVSQLSRLGFPFEVFPFEPKNLSQ